MKKYISPEMVDLGSIAGITAVEGVALQFDVFIASNGDETIQPTTGSIDSCSFVADTEKCFGVTDV